MGRDLLTPEEVKQLHFKTIIFPTIGFPIFRSTVVYKEFSCYQKGEIERKPKLLEDLSYTYFTVEKLNTKIKKQKMKKESSSEELDDFFEEMKNEFKEMVDEISKLLDNVKYNLDYPQVNGMMYCSIEIDNLLSGDDTDRIITLSNEKFHIEIESNNDKSIINIHKLL